MQTGDARRHHLIAQTRHNFDAGQITNVDGAIETLPRKSFLVNLSIGGAIEHTTDAIFQLANDLRRVLHEVPREVLVVDIAAAFDRVLEMRLDRVLGIERDIIAALHHARAAAFAEHPLAHEQNILTRIAPTGVQRCHEAGAACAKDEDVSRELLGGHNKLGAVGYEEAGEERS